MTPQPADEPAVRPVDEAAVEALLLEGIQRAFATAEGNVQTPERIVAFLRPGFIPAIVASLRRSEPPTADEEIDYRDLAGYASLAFFEERAVTQALRADPRRSICGVVSNSGPNGEPLACAYPPSPEGEPMHEHSWATLPTFAATPAVDEALVDEITRFREALRVSFAGSEWQRMEQAAASAALLGLTLHDDEHWDAPGSCRDEEQDCPECGGAGYDTATASDDVWRYPACGTCGGTGLAGGRASPEDEARRIATPPEGRPVQHGRHCPCTPCKRQDWTAPYLAPCGWHPDGCPDDATPPEGRPDER